MRVEEPPTARFTSFVVPVVPAVVISWARVINRYSPSITTGEEMLKLEVNVHILEVLSAAVVALVTWVDDVISVGLEPV